MPDHSFSKEIFPNIQSKPPPMWLEIVSSYPLTCLLGEETNTHHATTSFQVVVENCEISAELPSLHSRQTWFSLPLLIRLVLLHPSPASLLIFGHCIALQCLSCSEGPKNEHTNLSDHDKKWAPMSLIFLWYSSDHQSFITGIPTYVAQDMVGFLGCGCMLPAHVQFFPI